MLHHLALVGARPHELRPLGDDVRDTVGDEVPRLQVLVVADQRLPQKHERADELVLAAQPLDVGGLSL